MAFLDELKPGDKVAYDAGGRRTHYQIATVARLTKTQIITSRDIRFNRTTGRQVGGGRGVWAVTLILADPTTIKEELVSQKVRAVAAQVMTELREECRRVANNVHTKKQIDAAKKAVELLRTI